MTNSTLYTLVMLVAVGCGGGASSEPTIPPPSPVATGENPIQDIVTVSSKHDFATTAAKLETAITAKGLRVMSKVDHTANAESVGMTLPPTTLFIFGKPDVGTKLMLVGRTTALELPLKMLVWQGDDGLVSVTYGTPESMAARHQLDGGKGIVEKMREALDALAREATE